MVDFTRESVRWHPFYEFRRERRLLTAIALAIAVLIHVAIVVVLPDEMFVRTDLSASIEEDNVELILLEPEVVPPDEMRFVEANPTAPENVPDRTDQYSYRDQQAADENTDSSLLERPFVDGEEATQKILPGQLQASVPLEAGVYSNQVQPGEGEGKEGGEGTASVLPDISKPLPIPAPDFILQDTVSDEGPGSSPTISGTANEWTESMEKQPLDIYRPVTEPSTESQTSEGGGGSPSVKPIPRERPRLAAELIQGPLMNSRGSASRRGVLSIDSTFSEFGEYQQQFYAAIQVGWYQEIEFFRPIDTASKVQVHFTLHKDGEISDVSVVYSNASTIATTLCENAIIKRSPFRPWTQEMIEVFGDKRTLRLAFNYL